MQEQISDMRRAFEEWRKSWRKWPAGAEDSQLGMIWIAGAWEAWKAAWGQSGASPERKLSDEDRREAVDILVKAAFMDASQYRRDDMNAALSALLEKFEIRRRP